MFSKPAAFTVPVRRCAGAGVIMALWAAGGVAATAQTTTPSSMLSSAAGVTSSSAVAPVANPCQRFAAGSVVQQPPALFSKNGVLNVQFSYQTTTDAAGRQLFCFMTPAGMENPTLHLNAGDTLNITVTNNTPFNPVGDTTELYNAPTCGDTTQLTQNPANSNGMTGGSMNIHYHGTNVSPACHSDNVVKTLINPGQTFSYSIHFPNNEPPGLYWYHPHVHGLSEAAVQGGGDGVLVIDGVSNVQPATAGLRQRILVIRDLPTLQGLQESPGGTEGGIPQVDLSMNNIPLNATTNTQVNPPVTTYTPAVIHMEPGEQQFWRVSNNTSDVIIDLQVRFDSVPQTIQIVGLDGVPVNSQDGTQPGHLIPVSHFRLPPAARVEFLVNAPAPTVKVAQLVTQNIMSGPLGDDAPTRPLLNMQLGPDNDAADADDRVPAFTALDSTKQRFGGIKSVTPALTRTVFFEEVEDGSAFFINASGCVTASGAQCATQPYAIDTPFDNNNPPAIITTQGSVEKWIVQNHARENHELHQHQIHFMVLSQDNFEINGSQQAPAIDGQFLDMVEVPFCGGPPPQNGGINPPACVDANGNPVIAYPQVEALMDFRGPDIGDFVFHCHILGHEDRGMMAIERVVQPGATASAATASGTPGDDDDTARSP
ncbi:MAG TPA: multicopper oxidase domain-containing protein [Xanthobacteraceae bacterium]|jgi:FtsP/CotA-like multicopper oxidase with cupredoxin domain